MHIHNHQVARLVDTLGIMYGRVWLLWYTVRGSMKKLFRNNATECGICRAAPWNNTNRATPLLSHEFLVRFSVLE